MIVILIPLFLILSACTDPSNETGNDESEKDVVHVPYENGTEEVATHEIRTDQGVSFHFGKNYELSDEELIIPDASLITHMEKEVNIVVNRYNEENTTLGKRELETGDYFAEYDYIEVDVDTNLFPNLTNLGVYERDDNLFTGLVLYKDLNDEEFLYIEATMAPNHFTDDFKTELLAFFNTIETKA